MFRVLGGRVEHKSITKGKYVMSDITAMMLSDGHIALQSVNSNVRFMFVLLG